MRTNSILKWTLCLLIPGGSIALARGWKAAALVPFIGVVMVWLFSITRISITSEGWALMFLSLILLHATTYLWGTFLFITHGWLKSKRPYSKLLLLILLNVSIFMFCHVNKEALFGFAFYHIPSESMSPTLRPGDVVLVDTWAYRNSEPQSDDIIIIQKSSTGIVLAKRIHAVTQEGDNTLLFIKGDNASRSQDSRDFGWLDSKLTRGRVSFVWFSFVSKKRFLSSVF